MSEFMTPPKHVNFRAKKLFGDNAVYLSAAIMNSEYRNKKDEYINNAISVK